MAVLQNNILAGAAGQGGAAEYVIPKSLRFNSGDSASLSRTIPDITTFSFSFWYKHVALTRNDIFVTDSSYGFFFYQHTDGSFRVNNNNTNLFTSNGLYRDASAWYHLLLTNDGTTLKLYVNGVLDKAQTVGTLLNAGGNYIGRDRASANSYGNFLLADAQFVDGLALAPTDFGETRSDGVWVAKEFEVTGTVYNSYLTNQYSLTGAANLFDGSTSTLANDWNGVYNSTANPPYRIEFVPPEPISFTSQVEVYTSAAPQSPYNNKVYIDTGSGYGSGVSVVQNGWVTVTSGSGSFSRLKVEGQQNGTNIAAIRVDGTILTDGNGYGKNGFHLNFSDSSRNETLGYDSAPTIPDLDPKKGMDVITYTGTGSTRNVSGFQFEPGLLWTKSRSLNELHILSDSVRGVPNNLYAHLTNAQDSAGYLTSLHPGGFTVDGNAPAVNQSGATYVAWSWAAGGTPVANTDGSITSQVSANTDYGFSIVTYTGTSASTNTIGHGLGSAPKFIILKSYSDSDNWFCYHNGIDSTSPEDYDISLNTDGARRDYHTWNDTAPTSSVFSVGNTGASNENGRDYVAYCWSEVSGYSKFGSYTGNGSTTGPVITTGFKPRWILVKNVSSNSRRWVVWDTERDDDTLDRGLSPNLNSAEVTGFNANILSDGFQIVDSEVTLNENNSTFIYAAFADRPGNNWDVNNIVTNEGLTTSKTSFDVVTWDGNGGTQSIGGPVYSATSTLSNPTNAFNGNTSNGSVFNSTGNSVLTAGSMTITSSLEIYHNRTGSDGITVNINGTNYTATGLSSSGYHTIPIPNSDLPLTTTGNITIKDNQSNGSSTAYAVRVDSNVLVDGTGRALNFKPDFVWIKNRNGGHNHMLYDTIRGAGIDLMSNGTQQDNQGGSNDLTSFDQTGFSLGSNNAVNQSSRTYVAWAWKAGGAAVSNSDGSITSSVSANVAHGFSIVNHVGTNAAGTFGHGLSKAPDLMIFKNRAATDNWFVWARSADGTPTTGAVLNSTNAFFTNGANELNSILPTNSVVNVGSNLATNGNGQNVITYCFHDVPGYQRIGKYEGNATSGKEVVLGFKPRFLMIKSYTNATGWWIWDTERGNNKFLLADNSAGGNTNDAVVGSYPITPTNNGFTIDNTADLNQNGVKYIYLAIGDDEIGSDEDCLVDVPNAVTADADATDTTGGYQRGNYAIINRNDQRGTDNGAISNGNLKYVQSSNGARALRATIGVSSGKWFWEFKHLGGNASHGIAKNSGSLGTYPGGSDNDGVSWFVQGNIYRNGSTSTYASNTYAVNDIIGVALDMDNGTLTYYKNGVSQGTAASGLTGTWFPAFGTSNVQVVSFEANFGQMPFKHGLPSGYKALNTTALPSATIANGSTAFNTKIWSGDANTSRALTGYNMAPDLVWIKKRSGAFSHYLFDSVRGNTLQLKSDSSDAESTTTNKLISFDSDGFTVGNAGAVNGSGDTYVGWAWDAGSSTVSNTDGSTTSSLRANPSAGFSIVTYTGTGSNATVGHGLNTAPSLVIIKRRNDAASWTIYSSTLGATKYLRLNSTNAAGTVSSYFNDTAPTNSVFTVGTSDGVNGSGYTYLAYCFAPVAGYSAIGSYTGNASTDGPFVYTGFRPRWVMHKRTDTGGTNVGDWRIWDTARDTDNAAEGILFPAGNNAEATHSAHGLDILSNGFKFRTSDSNINASGGTYLYVAFAENPFQANGGLAR